MGDHFVLLVDRLLTESTLGAAIQSSYLSEAAVSPDDLKTSCSSHGDSEDPAFPRKLVECRICQDEDFDSNMEVPCSCCGSLKYAHRRCVQRWCNEKGDTICEICHQQFKPGYTAPPPTFHFGTIPVNLRGNWQISTTNSSNPRWMAVVSSDPDILDVAYAASTPRSLPSCHSVAIVFMVLLILRHTLPLLVNGTDDYSFPLVMLVILRTLGIILPVYVILKAVTALHRRRRQQVPNVTVFDEEVGGAPSLQQQPETAPVLND